MTNSIFPFTQFEIQKPFNFVVPSHSPQNPPTSPYKLIRLPREVNSPQLHQLKITRVFGNPKSERKFPLVMYTARTTGPIQHKSEI